MSKYPDSYSVAHGNSTHGGKRAGAGRKSTGRKPRSLYCTDYEYQRVHDYLKMIRILEVK